MNERLQEYLNKKAEESRAKFESERDANLIAAGLFEKRFSPTGKAEDPEYPFSQWNKAESRMMYYKKVAITVTDEEYEAFLKAGPVKPAAMEEESKNGVASTLFGIAVTLYILLGFAGLICMFANFLAGLIVMFGGFISGTGFLGFSEIIKQLQKLNNK